MNFIKKKKRENFVNHDISRPYFCLNVKCKLKVSNFVNYISNSWLDTRTWMKHNSCKSRFITRHKPNYVPNDKLPLAAIFAERKTRCADYTSQSQKAFFKILSAKYYRQSLTLLFSLFFAKKKKNTNQSKRRVKKKGEKKQIWRLFDRCNFVDYALPSTDVYYVFHPFVCLPSRPSCVVARFYHPSERHFIPLSPRREVGGRGVDGCTRGERGGM